RDTDLASVLGPGLHYHGWAILAPNGPWVEVAEPALVPRARRLVWSRELVLTSLVARWRVSPFGRLLSSHALPRPRPSLVSVPVPRGGRPPCPLRTKKPSVCPPTPPTRCVWPPPPPPASTPTAPSTGSLSPPPPPRRCPPTTCPTYRPTST